MAYLLILGMYITPNFFNQYWCNFFLTFIVLDKKFLSAYLRPLFNFLHLVSAEINQGRKLFKGGNYYFLGGFDRGNYSREETIQGRKLYEEIRYISRDLSQFFFDFFLRIYIFYEIVFEKIDTVFPRIVSSLEYFPPLNSFRGQNLLKINSFCLWIVSALE